MSKTEVINRKRECFKLHREIKDLSRQLDAIRGVLKANGGWIPGETLAESAARILKERDEAREELGNYKAESVHTCHSECKRPNCVLRRERAQAQVALVQALRERDEAREKLARITEAASAVVDRWEQPSWKDVEPTAAVIYRLRDALGREAE